MLSVLHFKHLSFEQFSTYSVSWIWVDGVSSITVVGIFVSIVVGIIVKTVVGGDVNTVVGLSVKTVVGGDVNTVVGLLVKIVVGGDVNTVVGGTTQFPFSKLKSKQNGQKKYVVRKPRNTLLERIFVRCVKEHTIKQRKWGG